MKPRSRKVIRVSREQSSRASSTRPQGLLTAASRAASSLSKRSLVFESPQKLRYVEDRLISEESPSHKLARRQALDAVLPRPSSPNGSMHCDSDREMREMLMDAMKAVEVSSVTHLRRVRSTSEKCIRRNRMRRKGQPSIASNVSTEVTEEPSWRRSHQVSTPSFSLDTSTEDHQNIVAEYLGEVQKMRRLKQQLSSGVLPRAIRPVTRSPPSSRLSCPSSHSRLSRTRAQEIQGTLRKVHKKKARTKHYVRRIQDVIEELRGSLDRSHLY